MGERDNFATKIGSVDHLDPPSIVGDDLLGGVIALPRAAARTKVRTVRTLVPRSRAITSCAVALAVVAFGARSARAELSTLARGTRGVVASAHPDASRAGRKILDLGGNAMDAAIATAYALAVVEPFSSGVGGGGFLLYWDARKHAATVIDYREIAPRRAHRDMYLGADGRADPKLSRDGITAVAVPGMVPGLADAQRDFGKLRLRDVVAPAIELASDGFLVTPRFRAASVRRLELLRANEEARRVFLRASGEPYEIGERLRQPDLARTFSMLAREGRSLFTRGRIARAIAKESKRLGGHLELDDLAHFSTRTRSALLGRYRGHTVLTMPPPSSGGVHLLQMLAMLELDRSPRNDETRNTHQRIEIMRRAFADRAAFMGDPAFVDLPIAGLLATSYLENRLATIDDDRASISREVGAGAPAGMSPPETHETTHLTVVDALGNVACLTQTVNYSFGAGVVVPGTGILLNNEMDDFSAAPGAPNVFGLVGGDANAIAPRKIPLSSMTPTIVLDQAGALRLALGAPGGPTIITTVFQIIVNVIDGGMDVARAVASPRIHMQWLPDRTIVEEGALAPETIQALGAMGHSVVVEAAWGNATAIEFLRDGTRVGVADPRGEGAADAQ